MGEPTARFHEEEGLEQDSLQGTQLNEQATAPLPFPKQHTLALAPRLPAAPEPPHEEQPHAPQSDHSLSLYR
ncbi:hypothetical protein [Desulfogranum mediterraneum]|uniref:hypothetical protein n=1 Tax=Desulfogranum mediterraneum TaxID=160661 RepID=UPI0004123EC5|nr:hypothetical protein [Desulfogranum mediterraneum]